MVNGLSFDNIADIIDREVLIEGFIVSWGIDDGLIVFQNIAEIFFGEALRG